MAGAVCCETGGPTLVDRSRGSVILLGMGCDIVRFASLKELSFVGISNRAAKKAVVF